MRRRAAIGYSVPVLSSIEHSISIPHPARCLARRNGHPNAIYLGSFMDEACGIRLGHDLSRSVPAQRYEASEAVAVLNAVADKMAVRQNRARMRLSGIAATTMGFRSYVAGVGLQSGYRWQQEQRCIASSPPPIRAVVIRPDQNANCRLVLFTCYGGLSAVFYTADARSRTVARANQLRIPTIRAYNRDAEGRSQSISIPTAFLWAGGRRTDDLSIAALPAQCLLRGNRKENPCGAAEGSRLPRVACMQARAIRRAHRRAISAVRARNPP